METLHAFDRHCYGSVCHCDFRLSIYGCVDSDVGRIMNIINIALSTLLLITGCGLIYHRIFIKGCTFISNNLEKGLLRPKPIDCMLLFMTMFNLLRLAGSIVIIIDVAPDNMAFRSFIWDNGFQWGFSGFTLYIIGIAQTLAETHRSISDSWLPSPIIVDTIGIYMIISSNVINCILSFAAGLVSKYNMAVAEALVRVHYSNWTILTGGLPIPVLYCGYRLVFILNRHSKTIPIGSERHKKLRAGILRIRLNMALITGCMLSFAVTVCLFAAMRDQVMKNTTRNAAFCVLWNILGSGTMFFIEALILFNPTSTTQSKGIKLRSSGEEPSSDFIESQNNSKTNDNTTFQDTLTRDTLDNINVKYEDLLQHSFQTYDEGPSNISHHTKKQRDSNKEIPKNVKIQRTGSRVLYVDSNYE